MLDTVHLTPLWLLMASVFALFLLLFIGSSIKVLREYERAAVFRLGRFRAVKGPGTIFVIPVIDRMVMVTLLTQSLTIAGQMQTSDRISVNVRAVVQFKVVDVERAVQGAKDYIEAIRVVALEALRDTVEATSYDSLVMDRELVASRLQETTAERLEPRGLRVGSAALEVEST